MGLSYKIYGLVQAGRCLFNIICDDKFEQSEADWHMFRAFANVEVGWWCLCTWTGSLLTLERR